MAIFQQNVLQNKEIFVLLEQYVYRASHKIRA